MAEIAHWNGHSFVVSPKLIRGFTGLTIRGSSETEDKTGDGQKYVARKNSNPSEITLTAELNALTGCDVKTDALKFVDEAQAGAQNYFYMGGKKLLPCQLMLTEADVNETTIAPGGTWVSCKVKLTMKQSAKYDGTESAPLSSPSGGGNSSKKASVKKKSTTTSGKTNGGNLSDVDVISSADFKTGVNSVPGALDRAVACVNAAKKASSLYSKNKVMKM